MLTYPHFETRLPTWLREQYCPGEIKTCSTVVQKLHEAALICDVVEIPVNIFLKAGAEH